MYCHDCGDYHAKGDPRCALNREYWEEQDGATADDDNEQLTFERTGLGN